MTNEELWRLFPIILSEHKPEWQDSYQKEKTLLEQYIGKRNIIRINHIGSTAVTGLIAKPTIDILAEIEDNADTQRLISNMESCGYLYKEQPKNPAPHMMFLKGYTPDGFKGQAFHVHVRFKGDWDELHFRDYLLAHPDAAENYGKLKLDLQKKYEHDRDGYTNAKTDFIMRITSSARVETEVKHF
ncbi:glutamate-rich GrpB [Dehalogenimonas sp. WBC-2]|nr:glutamate-rich GrpB [Dehalogenimonas sp. WBC-2]